MSDHRSEVWPSLPPATTEQETPGTGHLDMPGPPAPATPPEPMVDILQMEGPNQPWPGPPPQPDIPAPSSRRLTWTSKHQFLLSCLGYCVGLGHIWRFPYLCYRNGGGVFLILYFILSLIMGLPLFLMELSLGQYGATGPITVWKCCPLLKGIGIAMLITSSLVCVYYNVIIAWAFYYLVLSFQSPLPWSCDAPGNAYLCQNASGIVSASEVFWRASTVQARWCTSWPSFPTWSSSPLSSGGPHWTAPSTASASTSPWTGAGCRVPRCGAMQPRRSSFPWASGLGDWSPWPPTTSLTAMSSGERGRGARGTGGAGCRGSPGLPLGSSRVVMGSPSPTAHWDAPISILTSRAWGCDALPGRNTLVLAIGTCCTSFFAGFATFSVLGHMAWRNQVPVGSVTDSGPALIFVAYPEALSMLPISPLWSILFFLALIMLGVETLFETIQTITTAFLDKFPALDNRRKKAVLLGALCTSFYLLGLPLVTQGGIYWFTLIDKYSTSFGLITVCLFMCLGITFCYGVNQFCQDIMAMIRQCPPWYKHMLGYFKACWVFFTPCLLLSVLICACLDMQRVSLHNGMYEYAIWDTNLGIYMVVLTCLPVTLWAVVVLCRQSGTLRNRFQKAIQPLDSWRAAAGPNMDQVVVAWRHSPSP
ncbi:sodium-dependent proline transporter-like isoform X1 [Buteo buteo]|uniref:sodium-dependent proline transporter-like isoform X1 n=1 Tax=Buteo buteo TaxID=30397 RepID=UPI003EBE7E56